MSVWVLYPPGDLCGQLASIPNEPHEKIQFHRSSSFLGKEFQGDNFTMMRDSAGRKGGGRRIKITNAFSFKD